MTVLLGAAHKLVRKATRIGAQGNAVVTFVAAGYGQLLSLPVLDLEVSQLQRELGRGVVAGGRGLDSEWACPTRPRSCIATARWRVALSNHSEQAIDRGPAEASGAAVQVGGAHARRLRAAVINGHLDAVRVRAQAQGSRCRRHGAGRW